MRDGPICGRCGAAPEPGDAFCQSCGARLDPALGANGGGPPRDVPGVPDVPGGRSPIGATTARRAQGDAVSEATRYLCAGAYIDDEFGGKVLKELLGQTFRAVAPSYGFDVALVSAHCLAARRRRRIRDGALAAVALVMLFVGAPGMFLLGEFWWIAGWVIGHLRDGFDGLREAYHRIRTRSLVIVFMVLLVSFFVQFAVFVGSLLTALVFAYATSRPGAVPGAAASTPGDVVGQVIVGSFAAGVIGWFLLYGIVLWYRIAQRGTVARRLRREDFQSRPRPDVSMSPRLQARLDAVTWGQLGNVTVYSDFDPFIGAGEELLPDWSFAIPLVDSPGQDGAVGRFSLAALVAHVREQFAGIADPDDGATDVEPPAAHKLPGLTVSDHVFVSGLAVEGDSRFLPRRGSPPRTRLLPEEVDGIQLDPHGPVRHCCTVRVSSWEGEVVTSTFFHFSSDGEKLYFEAVRRVLRPVRWEYHEVDRMGPLLSFGDFLRLAAQAAGETVPAVLRSPFRVVADVVFDLRDDRPPVASVIDYGARVSARELGAEREQRAYWGFHNYFQLSDAWKHIKIVERHALKVILEHLRANGIDTSEFTRQVNVITNNTFNQTGSNNVISAVNTAAGGQATQAGTISAGSMGASRQEAAGS